MSQPSLSPGARFSASDAAFAGLSILRRRPSALLVWAGLLLVIGLVSQAGMVTMVGPQMQAMRSVTASGAATSPAALTAVGSLFAAAIPFYGVLFVVSILVIGVISAAINRAVLRPGEGGPGYLALGADELLQIAVIFIWALLAMAVYAVVIVIGAVIIGMGVGVGAASGRGGAALGGVLAFLGVVFMLIGSLCGLIWLNVKISFALPLTFDTRQLHVFSSFRMTRGRFWPLFGAYLVAWIVAIVISLVYGVLLASVGFALGGGLTGITQFIRPDTTNLAAFFTPLMGLTLVVGSIVQTVQWALIAGAPASAYAQLKGDPLAEVF